MNIQMMMNMIQQVQNPQQLLQRMGIPQECMENPQSVAKYLLDSGKINQQQINQAQQMYQQFRR